MVKQVATDKSLYELGVTISDTDEWTIEKTIQALEKLQVTYGKDCIIFWRDCYRNEQLRMVYYRDETSIEKTGREAYEKLLLEQRKLEEEKEHKEYIRLKAKFEK